MKTPCSFVSLVVLTSALALPVSAQHEPAPASPDATKPATHEPNQSAVDQPAHASDTNSKPAPQATAKGDDFARMDSDRDGRVSAKEYAASDVAAVDMVAAGKRSGSEAPDGGFNLANNEGRPDRSKFFRQVDTDGDGYLSRGELGAGQALTTREARK